LASVNSSQAGVWSSTSTWGGSAIPTAGDTVNIAHVVTYDINDDTNTITLININANGELKWLGGAGTLTLRFTNMVVNGGTLTGRSGMFLRCLGSIQAANTANSKIDILGTSPNAYTTLSGQVAINSTTVPLTNGVFKKGDYISIYDENDVAWDNQTNECFIVNGADTTDLFVKRFVTPKFTTVQETIINDHAFYIGDNETTNMIDQCASDFRSDYISYWAGENSTLSYHGENNLVPWTVSQGTYTNNTGTYSDGTLTAQTLNLTSGAGYDMYKRYENIKSGVSYSIDVWVKLGTATNLCVAAANGTNWTGAIGKAFTAADGLNSSTWTLITHTFTGFSSNVTHIHFGDNVVSSPINLSATQTAGSVFIKGLRVYSTAVSTDDNAIRLRNTTAGTGYLRLAISTMRLTVGMKVRIRFRAKSLDLTTTPTVLYLINQINVKAPALTTTFQDYEFVGNLNATAFYIGIPNSIVGNMTDITDIEIQELKDSNVGAFCEVSKIIVNNDSYTISSVDIYNKIIYVNESIVSVYPIGTNGYETGTEKPHESGETVYKLHASIMSAASRGLNYVDVSNASDWAAGDEVAIGGQVYSYVEDKTISSISIAGGIGGVDRIYLTTNLLYDHSIDGLVSKLNRDCIFHGNTTNATANACGFIYTNSGAAAGRLFTFKNFEMRYYGNNASTLYAGLVLYSNTLMSYTFYVSGVTVSPSVGATYTFPASGYTTATVTVRSVNITGGSGTFVVDSNTTWPPYPSGNLTRTGGTGDNTIAFSKWRGRTDKVINVSARHTAKTSNNGFVVQYGGYASSFINNLVYDAQWGLGLYNSGYFSYFTGNTAIKVNSVSLISYSYTSCPWEYTMCEGAASWGVYLIGAPSGATNIWSFNNISAHRFLYYRTNFCVSPLYFSHPNVGLQLNKINVRNCTKLFTITDTFGLSGAFANNVIIEEGLVMSTSGEVTYYADTPLIGSIFFNNYNLDNYSKSIRYNYGYAVTDYAIRQLGKYSWKFFPIQNAAIYAMGMTALIQANKGTTVKVGGYARKASSAFTVKAEIYDSKGILLASSTLSTTDTWEWLVTSYTLLESQNLVVRIVGWGAGTGGNSFWIDSPMIYPDNNLMITGGFDNIWIKADPTNVTGIRLTNQLRLK
jgi:hypothetical protein